MLATGPKAQLAEIGATVRLTYSAKESSAGPTRKLIGVEFEHVFMEDKAVEIRPSLKDYTQRICARFLKAFGGHLRPKGAPSTINLFENLCDVKGEEDCPDDHRTRNTPSTHKES